MQCALGASTLGSWRSSPTSLELRLPMLLEASNAWVRVLLFRALSYMRHVNVGALCADTVLDFSLCFLLFSGCFLFQVMDVKAFERLLGPCMDIMKRNIANYEEQLKSLFGSSTEIEQQSS